MSNPPGDGFPKGITLSNTIHSEVATCLPLPSLPVACGALEEELRLFDEPGGSSRSNRAGVSKQIADLLRNADVSYLNLKDEANPPPSGLEGNNLVNEVLQHNPKAFELVSSGHLAEETAYTANSTESRLPEQSEPVTNQGQSDYVVTKSSTRDHHANKDAITPRKLKIKKKKKDEYSAATCPDPQELQDAAVSSFCDFLENLVSKAEILSDERDETEWEPLSLADLRALVNEIMSIRAKGALHMVPVDDILRMLKILDHQIHRAEGLSIGERESSDVDVVSPIYCALESIHAALAIMAHDGMAKQIYKEENIERIIEFSRHQVLDVMIASDPAYRALHKPKVNEATDVSDEDGDYGDFGSSSKRRRTSKSLKIKKSTMNTMSATVNVILQKLCTILSFLQQLLSVERLSDSCIVQLVRTSLQTLLVDNIQLLQLKAISLIGGIYYVYTQHRSYVMDETLQVLLKMPPAKRVPRTYHLPDEEQRQIQLISALLIQLIHSSANLPDVLRQTSGNPSLDIPIDVDYPSKCHDAITESCCLFWSRVLERYTSTKNQDASEMKLLMENLVTDLLTTLNLPEYPASATILEVLCVLLLKNAGLTSKDVGARTMAIELLGTIASRLKHDALICREEKFWIVQELRNSETDDLSYQTDICSVCLDSLNEKCFVCNGCQKSFHVNCMESRELEVSSRDSNCLFCMYEKQLVSLKTYSDSPDKDVQKKRQRNSVKSSQAIGIGMKQEIVQQMLLNYLQDLGSGEELHLFTRWFYLCLWYKDDPAAHEKLSYYLARFKSRAIARDSYSPSTFLSRNLVKKITLALGQKSSFVRGFDKFLQLLLASMTEHTAVIRSKALRAVSLIVEADPEVLGDNRVQMAVEGRFQDSNISVREAALEIVGRHIASHPDVGQKYFEKVVERIKDTGLSVRKRAIKIIKEMCTSSSDFPQYTIACIELISRINDEESSIQDLVCRTFYEFWFEEPSGPQGHTFRDGSCVPLEVAKKTEQIVDMLRRLPSSQAIVTVIKRNLALDFFPQSAKAAGINPVLHASVRRRCELMCKCLLEKVLQVSETNNEEGEGCMLPYFLLLHSFCQVDPALCAPASDPSQFLVTLQPYLKSQCDNKVAAQLLESILFIMDSVLPLLRKVPMSILEELEQDLKHMIVRHSFLAVVHACIKCLCSAGKVAARGASIVEYLIQIFYKRLNALGFENKQQICRSLFCLGLLIRYGSPLLTGSASSTSRIDVASSLNLFKKYLQAGDFGIKVRALQALGYILIAQPEFMLQKDVSSILEAAFSASADSSMKIQSLMNMHEYLLDAESQMEPDKADATEVPYTVNGVHCVPVAAGAGDTNICGAIVQLYWNSILERSLDVNGQVRQTALKIMEIVLRQGLVHPITCVPFLIALETDPLEANVKLAHQLLMNVNEKYPAFFESRLGDGLQYSFMFIHAMSEAAPENLNLKSQARSSNNTKGKSDPGSAAYARTGVSRIYKIIRGNRSLRNRFMFSVIRKFEMPTLSDLVIPFLIYCSEILALLPFSSPDEPLYLIYTINRLVQVKSGSLESNMKDFLHSLHVNTDISNGNRIAQNIQTATPVIEKNMAADCIGEVHGELHGQHLDGYSALTDSTTTPMNPRDTSSISTADFQKIQADCLAAGAVQLLLRLKRHLKIIYSLDDQRCQAFNPSEPQKPGETISRQNVPFNISDVNIDPPNSYEELLRRYQDFKNALKEDTVDYSTYTANIKRKRPTAKRTPKAVRMTYVDDEDEGDDEDWGSGVKQLNKSGNRPKTRRTRQRP